MDFYDDETYPQRDIAKLLERGRRSDRAWREEDEWDDNLIEEVAHIDLCDLLWDGSEY